MSVAARAAKMSSAVPDEPLVPAPLLPELPVALPELDPLPVDEPPDADATAPLELLPPVPLALEVEPELELVEIAPVPVLPSEVLAEEPEVPVVVELVVSDPVLEEVVAPAQPANTRARISAP